MLTEAETVDYLVGQHMLTMADIVRGGLIVEDLSRRNRNFVVRSGRGTGFFLKQSDARQQTNTLHREADIYSLLWAGGGDFAKWHMPALRRFDHVRQLLILERLDEVEPLGAIHSRDADVAVASAMELGRALGRLHELPLPDHGDFEAPPPWVLSIFRPIHGILADFSSAAISAIQIVQERTFVRRCLLDLARTSDHRALIHADMRAENCLVRVREGVTEPDALFLVDWELAGVGDPCWDVGAVFCEYLTIWVRSIPIAPSLSLHDSLALATHTLPTVLPCLAAFWDAYRQARTGWGRQPDFLVRSIRSAGARMIQSAVESAQMSAQLTSTVVYMLQLAENVLGNPRQAGGSLLGLRFA